MMPFAMRAIAGVLMRAMVVVWVAGCAGIDLPAAPTADGSPGHGLRIVVPADEIAALERAPSCCASLATLPFGAFAREGPLTLRLDADAPVFAFDGGRSRFAAFRLPDWPRPLELEVVSRVSALRPDFMPSRTVFNPAILLLDGQFRIVRTLQGPDAFSVHEPAPGQSSIEVRGRAWIDEPPAQAAYLVLLTTDALRARTARARGVPIIGFSPEGLVDLSLRSLPFVTPPVRFRVGAYAADAGTLPRLTLHADLLVIDDRGAQFAERRDQRFVPVTSIPFDRIVSARWDDGLLARDRLLIHWLDGEASRASRFSLVREPDQPYDALAPILDALASRIRPAWHRETVSLVVEDAMPEVLFRQTPAGAAAAGRIRDDAMLGGTLTAGVCALCYGGTCPPQVLASCAGLFAVGAAVGTVVGISRELATGDTRAPAPTPIPPQEIARGEGRVRAGASARLSASALGACLRRPAGQDPQVGQDAAGAGPSIQGTGSAAVGEAARTPGAGTATPAPSDAAWPTWWVEQGRRASPADAAADGDFVLTVALGRVELTEQPFPGDPAAPVDRPARLTVVARFTLAPPGVAASAAEVAWAGPMLPLRQWSAPDGAALDAALQAACEGLAGEIRARAGQVWRALPPGAGRPVPANAPAPRSSGNAPGGTMSAAP